ncbi:hypothetical protein, partial [Hymenobacter coalescens]
MLTRLLRRLAPAAALLLGAAAGPAAAQHIVWEKRLASTPGLPRPEFVKRVVATPQGTLFCSMAATGNVSTLRSHFWLLDAATGDSLWQRPGLPQLSGEQAACLLPDGRFGFVTEERVPTTAQVPVGLYMQEITSTGAVPLRVLRPHPNPSNVEGEIGVGLVPVPAPAGGYLLASQWVGTRYPRNQSYMLSVTAQGSISWQRGYAWGRNDDLLDAKLDARGRAVLFSQYLPDAPGARFRLKLMQVDPVTGDSLHAATFTPAGTRGEPSSNTLNQVLALRDGGLVLTGSVDTLVAGQGRRAMPFALKVDARLRPVWTHLLPPPAPGRYLNAVELLDGSVLVLAEAPPAAAYRLHHLDGASGRLLAAYAYASQACPAVVGSALAPGADGRTVYVSGGCAAAPGSGYVARLALPAALPPVLPALPLAAAPPPPARAPAFALYPNPAAGRATLRRPVPAAAPARA